MGENCELSMMRQQMLEELSRADLLNSEIVEIKKAFYEARQLWLNGVYNSAREVINHLAKAIK